MFALDLHTHTRFFHGHRRLGDLFDPVGFRILRAVARRRGLDGLATTNHDYHRTLGTPVYDGEFVTVPGVEVSSTRGHVLVVGPDPPRETDPGELTPLQVVDLAHERGCAAIIAHPYRNSTVRDADAPFDAIEVNGKHPRTSEWVERLAERHDLPMVGGSDAHYPIEVGRAHTLVDVDDPSPAAVVAAIRDGRVEPRIDHSLAFGAMRRSYRYLHEQKGWLSRPEPTPGVGEPPEEPASE